MATQARQQEDVVKVEGGRLIINVALTDGHLSGSGKSKVFYTTAGNIAINDGFKLGLTLYKAS